MQQILGHHSILTTARYTHLTSHTTDACSERLNALMNGYRIGCKVRKRTAIPPRPYGVAVSLRRRCQAGCQRCGSNSPIWLAHCIGRRAITSRR